MADLATLASANIAATAPAAKLAHAQRDPKSLDKTAEDFEAVFLSQMLESMFKGIKTSGPFGGGHAEEMMRSFMLQEYGKVMAAGGGVGIADAVKREMLHAQEGK
jgi:Rod binding domain-containing protein